MPQAVDIVINNAAAVAKTFTLMAPAAGDGASAKFALKEGTIRTVFPKLEISSRPNGNKARKTWITLTLPSSYTDSVTGLTNVGSAAQFNGVVSMPDDFPESRKDDFQAFVTNAMANALVKACVRDALGAN